VTLLDQAVSTVVARLPRGVVGAVARRYISGETLESAIAATERLNARGMSTTIDVLGENVADLEEALLTVELYRKVLSELHSRSLKGNISVKLTHLGLRIDEARCYEYLRALVADGDSKGIFVRIDMEDSTTTEITLEFYRRLREEGFTGVGAVLQAYLRRSADDAARLARMPARVRVCKGIYREREEIAFHDHQEINESFLRIVEILLRGGCHVAIATHDDALVEGALEILESLGGCGGSYEFQMLLGVTEKLRDSIVARGHPLRVYVPFGEEWHAYSIRRLRENPRIAGHVFRALLGLGGRGSG
jgi:proline dehydrogenase